MPEAKAVIEFTTDNAAALRGIEQINAKLGSQTGIISGLGASLKGLAAAYISLAGAQKLLELLKLGEDLADVRQGFNNLTGNAPAALARLRTAVNGTVDDLTLMKLATAAIQKGLNWEQVVQTFEFSKIQAETTGDGFESVLDRVTSAMARLAEGSSESSRALIPLGINGKNVTEVMQRMRERIDAVSSSSDSANDSIDQFYAKLKNFTGQVAGGLLSGLAFLSGDYLASGLIAQRAWGGAGAGGGAVNTFDQFGPAALNATALAKALSSAITPLAQLDAKIADVTLKMHALNIDEQTYKTLQGELNGLAIERTKLLEDQAAADDAAAKTTRDAKVQELDLERQLLAAKQGTGEQRRALANQQLDQLDIFYGIELNKAKGNAIQIENLQREKLQAYIAILNFRNAAQSDVDATREKASAHLANSEIANAKFIQEYEGVSLLERLTANLTYLQDVLSAHKAQNDLQAEDLARLETAELESQQRLTEYLRAETDKRIAILQEVFGNTFLSIFDDILEGSKKRFEHYLSDLLKAILKFLASRALMKFFGMLAGSIFPGGSSFLGLSPTGGGAPAGGGGGGVPYSLPGGGVFPGGAPGGNLLDGLGEIIQRINTTNLRWQAYQSQQAAPIRVDFHTDALGLYALVQQGAHQFRKTDLTR